MYFIFMKITKPLALRFEKCKSIVKEIKNAASLLNLDFCDVTGFGKLKSVKLANNINKLIKDKDSHYLVSLKGRIRRVNETFLCDFMCVLSSKNDGEISGGMLRDASADYVELTFWPLKDVSEIIRKNNKSEKTKARLPIEDNKEVNRDGWDEAIKESKRLSQEIPVIDSELIPQRGDIVNHVQFGKCQVMRVGDDHITIKHPGGRMLQLGMSVLKFIPAGKDGKKIFLIL